jgi:ribosome-binding protein aMBF1 (putative translation factor)
MKLSELKTSSQVLEEQQQDPEFRAEWDRTALARDVALRIVRYRTENRLTQSALARSLGMTQSVIARLEAGDQPPSIGTLAKLTSKTGLEFDIHFARGSVQLLA